MFTIKVTPSRNLDDDFNSIEEAFSLLQDAELSLTQKEILYKIFTIARYWYIQVLNNIGPISIDLLDISVGDISKVHALFLRHLGIQLIDPSESLYAMRKRLNGSIEVGNICELQAKHTGKVLETSYKDATNQLVRFPVNLFDPTKLKKVLDDIIQPELPSASQDRAFRMTPLGVKKG